MKPGAAGGGQGKRIVANVLTNHLRDIVHTTLVFAICCSCTHAPSLPGISPRRERVWIDRELTFTGERIAETDPLSDWQHPVDYYNGTIEVRVVVKNNVDGSPVWLELVMWSKGFKSPHQCLSCLAPSQLTAPGTYSCHVSPSHAQDGWHCNQDALDFTKHFGPLQFSAKLAKDDKRSKEELRGAHVPFSVRYTAVLVPSGQAFSGWSNYQ